MHDFRDKNCGLRDGKSDQCWFKEEGFGRVGGNGYAKLAFFLPILKRMAKHCCEVLMLIYFSQATFIITRLYSPLSHSLSRAPVSLTYLQLYDQWLLTPSFPFVAKRWHALGLLALIFIWLKRIFRVHLVVDMWRYFIRGCFRVHCWARYGRVIKNRRLGIETLSSKLVNRFSTSAGSSFYPVFEVYQVFYP